MKYNISAIQCAVARLDNWTDVEFKGPKSTETYWYKGLRPEEVASAECGTMAGCTTAWQLPQYVNSYNAILPVIQNQDYDTIVKILYVLDLEVFDGWHDRCLVALLKQTPLQICVGLLKGKDMWKPEYERNSI